MNLRKFLWVSTIFILLSFHFFNPRIWAESSNDKLDTYVAQLQDSPDDVLLREKIIKLVRKMPTKPTTPDGLVELMGKVKYIMENGSSQDDFVKAAEAYKEAALLAPWEADVYYNLGKIEEKAKESEDALVSYSLYLVANPNAKDRESVEEKIGAMEYASGTTFKELEKSAGSGIAKSANVVTFITSKGSIKVQLFSDVPITTKNFIDLVSRHFYDGLTFHRYVSGFVIQGGDPEGTGQGGSGKTIPLEITTHKHLKGALAMARASDPNSASSQFYFCLADLPSLDGQYTVFGQVIEGMDNVLELRQGDIMNKVEMVK